MDRLKGRERRRGGEACAIRSCLSVCLSVLTQSKSICPQDCHCGTKREGSLPGRTHSERNGERQDRHKEARWRLGGAWVGGLRGAATPPTPNAPAVVGGDAASSAPINPFVARTSRSEGLKLKTQRETQLMGGWSHLQEGGGTSLLGGRGGRRPLQKSLQILIKKYTRSEQTSKTEPEGPG